MSAKTAEYRIQVAFKSWILTHVGHKFRLRALEWLAAVQLTLLGMILLAGQSTFSISPSYVAMAKWGTEFEWGAILFASGLFGLVGLVVNGGMEAVTPWIRVTRALLGAAVFSMIGVGLLVTWLAYGNPPSTGLAMYWMMAVAEVVSIHNAIADARIYQNGRRNRRNPTSGNR